MSRGRCITFATTHPGVAARSPANELYEDVVKGQVDPNNLLSSYGDLVRAVHEVSIRLKALEATQTNKEWGGNLGSGILSPSDNQSYGHGISAL